MPEEAPLDRPSMVRPDVALSKALAKLCLQHLSKFQMHLPLAGLVATACRIAFRMKMTQSKPQGLVLPRDGLAARTDGAHSRASMQVPKQ